MGLFGDMKAVVRKHARDKVDDAVSAAAGTGIGQAAMRSKKMVDAITGRVEPAQVELWAVPDYKGSVLLEPRYDGKLYVYYPEPLRAVRQGERFLLEAVPGDVVLHSSYSGNTVRTRDSGTVAYKYRGEVVGMSSYFSEAVTELMRSGYRVHLEAEKLGVYDKDVPEVALYGNRSPECTMPLGDL